MNTENLQQLTNLCKFIDTILKMFKYTDLMFFVLLCVLNIAVGVKRRVKYVTVKNVCP